MFKLKPAVEVVEEPIVKEKKLNFFPLLNEINMSKQDLFRNGETDVESIQKAYDPFMINRGLSFFIDTILHANEMNMRPGIDKVMQNDFYLARVRKRKRFSKWFKGTKSKDVQAVAKYFNYSYSRAEQVMGLIDNETIKNIKLTQEEGGKK